MTSTQHTATPWYFDGAQVWAPNGKGPGMASNICKMMGTSQQANGEFIARACNTHEELLAILKEVIAYEDEQCEPGSYGEEVYDRAHAIIARAEGVQ